VLVVGAIGAVVEVGVVVVVDGIVVVVVVVVVGHGPSRGRHMTM
jgi:hypothetical protein